MTSGDEAGEPESRKRRISWIVGLTLAALLCVYIASAVLYLRDLDQEYVAPTPTDNGIAISLIPFDIDTQAQVVSTEMLIFPGAELLSADRRLAQDITIDVFAAESQTITFDKGTVPSPVKVNIPALGVVQRYPFDTYRYSAGIRSATGGPKARIATTIPTEVSVFFDLAGWNYLPVAGDASFQGGERTFAGQLSRDGSTRTIAVTFILLIMMFGILAVTAVVAGLRGRLAFAIGTAAWLTGALFALVSLRNGLPGNPPLGSVMDVLVYFWVIAAIMIAIGVTVITLVVRADDTT